MNESPQDLNKMTDEQLETAKKLVQHPITRGVIKASEKFTRIVGWCAALVVAFLLFVQIVGGLLYLFFSETSIGDFSTGWQIFIGAWYTVWVWLTYKCFTSRYFRCVIGLTLLGQEVHLGKIEDKVDDALDGMLDPKVDTAEDPNAKELGKMISEEFGQHYPED